MGGNVFEFVAGALEAQTDLGTLEARGTVRLALKEAGLDPRGVTSEQMAVVLEKVMPGELRSRGVDRPESICAEIATRVAGVESADAGSSSPEEVFRRLASS